MTQTFKTLTSRLSDIIAKAPLCAGTLRLEIPQNGTLYVAGYSVSDSPKRADCTLTVGHDHFRQFLDGSLDPHWALMGKTISYSGDFAVARAFGGILSSNT